MVRDLSPPTGSSSARPTVSVRRFAEADRTPTHTEVLGDGSVTRRLESPLFIADVVVPAAAGRELRAVQAASLFAGFARRWVAAARGGVPDATMLEAKLCGVGIVGPDHRVLVPAEKPVALTRDGWSWLLEERAYRRWLSGRPGIRGPKRPAPATDGARTSPKG
jgi:hypothetical protein